MEKNVYILFFNFLLCFIYLFMTVQGHCCYSDFSLVAVSRGYSSLQWLLLLWSTGSRSLGFQLLWNTVLVALWHVGSSRTRNWTGLSWNGRWILYHWATRETQEMYFKEYLMLQRYLHMSNVLDVVIHACSFLKQNSYILTSKFLQHIIFYY